MVRSLASNLGWVSRTVSSRGGGTELTLIAGRKTESGTDLESETPPREQQRLVETEIEANSLHLGPTR